LTAVFTLGGGKRFSAGGVALGGSGVGGEVPAGRRERKKLEVRDRIRVAALELFREKGYAATTVEEIAERADVAKGTFFNHFARKDSLLEALGEEMMELLLEELGPLEEWEGSARDQILRYFSALGRYVERDPEVTKEMMIENLRIFWLSSEPTPGQHRFEAVTRTVLRGGVGRGEIGGGVSVEVAAKLLEAAYITTMVDWLKAGGPGERYRADLTQKVDIVFRGLAVGTEQREGRGV
jgi:TetR/AcrR family transcriptional regulator, cholesterol catabolism regulator